MVNTYLTYPLLQCLRNRTFPCRSPARVVVRTQPSLCPTTLPAAHSTAKTETAAVTSQNPGARGAVTPCHVADGSWSIPPCPLRRPHRTEHPRLVAYCGTRATSQTPPPRLLKRYSITGDKSSCPQPSHPSRRCLQQQATGPHCAVPLVWKAESRECRQRRPQSHSSSSSHEDASQPTSHARKPIRRRADTDTTNSQATSRLLARR